MRISRSVMFLLQNPGAKLLLGITITELIMIGSVISQPTYNYDVPVSDAPNRSVSDAPTPSVPDAPPSPEPEFEEPNKRKEGISEQVRAAIVVLIGVVVLFFIPGLYFLSRRVKKRYNTIQGDTVGDEISAVQSLRFYFGAIRAATNNFSEDNKIGGGGFGSVYKGLLPNGQEVAMKCLYRMSGQGVEEFKNAVVLVAKLQHRNLVKLLGFCLAGEAKILVYEYVPNKNLDYYLFDSNEGVELDWKRRLFIINGIAQGLLYLHVDSQLRIIHTDLKASNVLLDHEMNPKISDVGMARIFCGNPSEVNINIVVGTYGYIAPEYAMGLLPSVKSDVFSFGVLLLEIISGKKNSGFHHSEDGHSLLTFAWKLWYEGRGLELVDPLLVQSCVAAEVSKCIHIGLLCVQEDPAIRPTMSFVFVMLASDTMTLPQPTQPAFFVGRHALIPTQSSSDVNVLSANELTVPDLSPQ